MNKKIADIAAVKKLAKEWTAAWNRGDADALLSLFAADPVLLPQGRPAVTGKRALRALYRSFFREYRVKGRGRVVDAAASGDLGYFLSIVRRRKDGSWKISRLIDNSDRE